MAVLFLIGTLNALAQEKKYSVYAIGFYNLENLFDTLHDEGHNDYEYLPDGRNKWTGMKYRNKLKNMARVLAEMGTDELPTIGCAAIGVSEVENDGCLADLCEQEPLKKRNFQHLLIEGPDHRGVDCGLLYNPALFSVRNVKLVPYIYDKPVVPPVDFSWLAVHWLTSMSPSLSTTCLHVVLPATIVNWAASRFVS